MIHTMGIYHRLIFVGLITATLVLAVDGWSEETRKCVAVIDSVSAGLHKTPEYDSTSYYAWVVICRCPRLTTEDSAALAWGYHQMCGIFDQRQDFRTALDCVDSAARIWDRLPPIHRKPALSTYLGAEAIARRIENTKLSDQYYARACQESLIVPISQALYPGNIFKAFGDYWKVKADHKLAMKFYRRANDYFLSTNGEEDQTRHSMLLELGNLSQERGEFDEAERFHRLAMELRVKLFGEISPQVASCLCNLGNVYYAQSLYDSALAYYNHGLSICSELKDSGSDISITLMGNIADVNAKMGRLDEAAATYERLITLKRDDPNRSLVAAYLSWAADIYFQMGELDRATELLEEALSLRLAWSGLPPSTIAGNRASLARIYIERANYRAAETLFLDAISAYKAFYGPDYPWLADIYIPLGNLYFNLDRWEDAESAYLESRRILTKKFGKTHDQIAEVEVNLARLYQRLEKPEQSIKSLARASEILRQLFGKEHPRIATLFALQAEIDMRSGRLTDALQAANECLQMQQALLSRYHPDIATTWRLIGEIQFNLKKFDLALAACEEAEEIIRNTFGANHPDLATVLELHAQILVADSQTQPAFRAAASALDIRYRHFRINGITLSEKDALRFARHLQRSRDLMLSCFFALETNSTEDAALCADLVAKTKSLVMQDITLNRYRADSPQFRKLKSQTLLARAALATRFVEGQKSNSAERFRSSIDSLLTAIESYERQLALLTTSDQDPGRLSESVVESIQHRIEGTMRVIDYIKYISLDNSARYATVVISRSLDPQIVYLGRADSIDALVSTYVGHFDAVSDRGYPTRSDLDAYRPLALQLYVTLVKPCLSGDFSAGKLVIAPDGSLNLISFGTLMDRDESYLVESHDINYLTTARQFLTDIARMMPATGPLLAIGDPDFNSLESPTLADAGGNRVSDTGERRVNRNRGLRNQCIELNASHLSQLPSSKQEIKSVGSYCDSMETDGCKILLGPMASEEMFKSCCKGSRIIHIATHGYALGPDCGGQSGTPPEIDDPMLNSGLFLAGANRALERISAGQEDGVLTAAEVIGLDLRATEMVVLSSCLSGSGKVFDGEGISGLRRAFVLAGAQCVISALWQVPDIETAELMSQVYLSDAAMPAVDLNAAQRHSISALREEGRLDHPFSWGAFVMTGLAR